MSDQSGYFTGKSIIITGGYQGIGRAITELAIAQGAQRIFSLDNKFPEDTDGQCATGTFIHERVVDTRDPHGLTRIGIQLRRLGGNFDSLILNAGIKPVDPDSDSEAQLTREVNVSGTRTSFDFLHYYLNRDSADAVFMSSDLISDSHQHGAYVESKRAIAVYCLTKAASLRKVNYRFLTILPGPVSTELFNNGKSAETLARIETETGVMTPAEFANRLGCALSNAEIPNGSFIRIYRDETSLTAAEDVLAG